MSVVQVKGKDVELDEDGFLVNPDDWSNDMVEYFASVEDVSQLTENHWKMINYLRDYFKKFGVAPMVRKLCKDTGFSLKEVYEMFPSGPAKGACKLAGLPKPTGCV
jgi:TusE/DsrC/DsvC family sulfur relay protein